MDQKELDNITKNINAMIHDMFPEVYFIVALVPRDTQSTLFSFTGNCGVAAGLDLIRFSDASLRAAADGRLPISRIDEKGNQI
jgi:hypothetical protein